MGRRRFGRQGARVTLTDEQLGSSPFDQLVAELQRVVGVLEAGNLPLEETIELYRYALRLHGVCEERLRTAELKIVELGRRGEAAQ